MKNKLLSIFLFMNTIPIAAMAAGDYSDFDDRVPLSERLLREYKTENPNVIFRDRKEASRNDKFYMGLAADLSFLSWKNEMSGTDEYSNPITGEDKFNFKPVVGLDLSLGYRFNKNWRMDVDFGYVGKFSETETEYYGSAEKTEFNLETFYGTVNAYYDLFAGFYIGLGGGLAITRVNVDNSEVDTASMTATSPMGAAMLGWSYMLDEKIDFDIHYKFSVFNGNSTDMKVGDATVKTGSIMGNTLSAGIRYHF